jgi:hypothetical protein
MRLLLLALTGCSTITLRTGAVMSGDRPAFQASVELGPSVANKRHGGQLSDEAGVQVGRTTSYVLAMNADFIHLDEDTGPISRIGARFRTTGGDSAAIGLRGAFFTGILRDPDRASAGLGVEFAGGYDAGLAEPVFEAVLVLSHRVRID